MTEQKYETSARIYVGTYGKYASGSIKGAWLNLEDYADRDAFLEACAKLHSDEADPELMFQDYEGFPSGFYSESSAPPQELWDWLELDEDERDMLDAYQSCMDANAKIEDARDAFCGKYDSERDFAESWHDEIGDIDAIPESLRYHIDWDSVVREMKCSGDFMFHRMNGDVYVFRGN